MTISATKSDQLEERSSPQESAVTFTWRFCLVSLGTMLIYRSKLHRGVTRVGLPDKTLIVSFSLEMVDGYRDILSVMIRVEGFESDGSGEVFMSWYS